VSDGRGKRAKRPAPQASAPPVDRTPPWDVIYYQAPDGTVPALAFLDGCLGKLEGELVAVLDAVAAAPPPQFSGGGKWEAMHGEMTGYHEIRLTGPGREQFRLFCLLENAEDDELRRRGLAKPAIVVLDGRRKPWRTVLTAASTARSESSAKSTRASSHAESRRDPVRLRGD
jgi:hypothetical protein